LALTDNGLELIGGHNLQGASLALSTIDSAELNGTDIVAHERYSVNVNEQAQMFYTGVATVSWHWNGTDFIPTITKAPLPTSGSQACTASAIAAGSGTIFYSGPTCAGDWAIGTVEDLRGTDMDFVFQEVFHFIDGAWHDIGQYYISGNCTVGLTSSGMPRAIALQLSPNDFCLLPPVNTFIAEPSTGPIKAGDQGARVKRLQIALQQIVDPGLVADGQFGVATEIAVLTLQEARGLDRDGIAGPATFAALGLAYP
jgi:hypothetical protein